MLIASLEIIRDICWLIYGGTIISFSLYLPFSAAEKREQQLTSFMNLGSVLGINFGGAIFAAILLRWLTDGHYYPINTLETMAFCAGFILWVSNIILEIWTLDPLRKLQSHILTEKLDPADVLQRCCWHIYGHTLLILLTHILFIQAGS